MSGRWLCCKACNLPTLPRTRRPPGRLQDQSAKRRREAAVLEAKTESALNSALNIAPGLAAADERLADLYRARMEAAEAQRDPDLAARYETMLRSHDRGKHMPPGCAEPRLSPC